MAFGETEAEERQIKRLYAVLHSLGIDPKAFKKEKGFSSYAKLSWDERSKYISELEAQEKANGGHGDGASVTVEEEVVKKGTIPTPASEIAKMGSVLAECTREALLVTEELCYNGGITEGQKAALVQKYATTLFIEAMRRGL